MTSLTRLCWLILGLSLTSIASADGLQFGVTLPILIKAKDPEGVHGYRAVVWYQPSSLVWSKFNIYFAGSFGHWWVHGAKTAGSLNIYAIAPVLRYYFVKTPTISPYIEASIGAAYLTRTHFSTSNLGIHYSFQDEVAIGAVFGKEQRFYASVSALHYSNASMASSNAGITIPVILNLGYQFG